MEEEALCSSMHGVHLGIEIEPRRRLRNTCAERTGPEIPVAQPLISKVLLPPLSFSTDEERKACNYTVQCSGCRLSFFLSLFLFGRRPS